MIQQFDNSGSRECSRPRLASGWIVETQIGSWKLPLRSELDRWHAPKLEMNFPDHDGMGIKVRVAQRMTTSGSADADLNWSDWYERTILQPSSPA